MTLIAYPGIACTFEAIFNEYIPLQRYLFQQRRISTCHVGLMELFMSQLKRISKYHIKMVIVEMNIKMSYQNLDYWNEGDITGAWQSCICPIWKLYLSKLKIIFSLKWWLLKWGGYHRGLTSCICPIWKLYLYKLKIIFSLKWWLL